MGNGANRLFKVIKNTGENVGSKPSQIVSLTVKSIQPLVFMRDDRLEITEEFCIFSKLARKENIRVGDVVIATVFNDGQLYFIEQNNNDDLVVVSKNDLYKNQITYNSWHNVLLMRSDGTYIYLMLYGCDLLKEGTYSIKNAFKMTTIGTMNAEITVPLSAIQAISRKDWGFEVIIQRSQITEVISSRTSREYSNDYNGIGIVHDGNLIIQST